MTRTQLQLPDSLYGQAKDYADFREISMAEVFRNAIEMFIRIHVVEPATLTRRSKWQPPVCRSTGLRQDPFADDDWREKLHLERGSEGA